MLKGTLVRWLEKLEVRMEEIEEEKGSDNETIVRKTAKKEKRVLRNDGTSLSQLEEEMGIGFVEPAVTRTFGEVRTNVFERAPLSWKLEDFQER